MKCRVGLNEAHPLVDIARRTASAATQLGEHLTGTVVFGLDDPYCFHPDDTGPRILVPMTGGSPPSALGKALLTLSSVVVAAGPADARIVQQCAPGVPLVRSDLHPDGPLKPRSPIERAQVNDILRERMELRSRVHAKANERVDPIEALALSCIEAVLMCPDRIPSLPLGERQQ